MKVLVGFFALIMVLLLPVNAPAGCPSTSPTITSVGVNYASSTNLQNIWASIGANYSVASPSAYIQLISITPATGSSYGSILGTFTGNQLNIDTKNNSVSVVPNTTENSRFFGEGLMVIYGDTSCTGGSKWSFPASLTSPDAGVEATTLWNPGPKWIAGETLANVGSTQTNNWNDVDEGCSSWDTSLTEASKAKNPSTPSFPALTCYNDAAIPAASNGAGPTYYVDIRVGWLASDVNKNPGWSIWQLS